MCLKFSIKNLPNKLKLKLKYIIIDRRRQRHLGQ